MWPRIYMPSSISSPYGCYLILIITLHKRYFLSPLTPHFTEEETKAEKKSSFADLGRSESKVSAFPVLETDWVFLRWPSLLLRPFQLWFPIQEKRTSPQIVSLLKMFWERSYIAKYFSCSIYNHCFSYSFAPTCHQYHSPVLSIQGKLLSSLHGRLSPFFLAYSL